MEFANKSKYNIGDLLNIVSFLRSDKGCPWDREQDHKTIRKNFIEETYEAVEAIDLEDTNLLKEELGDVLLQVVFHSQIEKEENHFEFDDVVDGLCKKLIERHPHVFSDVIANDSAQALENWNKVKMDLKGQKNKSDAMESVSKALPSLMRSLKVQKKAFNGSPDFNNINEALTNADEEFGKMRKTITDKLDNSYKEKIGEMLFSVVNISRCLNIDPEEALSKYCDKFIDMYKNVEVLANDRGIDMNSLSIDNFKMFLKEVQNS